MKSDKLRTLIIEDERSAMDALHKLIVINCPEVELIGEARTVEEGLEQIINLNPDLIMMDIQLGDEQSFKILENIPTIRSHVIFVTAFDQYAIDAFRFSAIDYLLKPVNPSRLREAIDKVVEKVKYQSTETTLNILVQNLKTEQLQARKLVLSTLERLHVVEINTIVKCQSDMNYTTFYFTDGKQLVISKTLKEFEEQLVPYDFFRIHKSWLINKHYIRGYDKTEGGYAIMEGDSKVPVSALKKEELLAIIKEAK